MGGEGLGKGGGKWGGGVECRMYVFSNRPGVFSGQPENTSPFHASRLHVQNLDTSVECMFFQVVPAFFPAGRPAGKHKSISCRSIVQNLDTSVECMFCQVVPAFFLAGQSARKHKSISCRSIVQNLDTSVEYMFFQFLFTLCLHSCLHSASTILHLFSKCDLLLHLFVHYALHSFALFGQFPQGHYLLHSCCTLFALCLHSVCTSFALFSNFALSCTLLHSFLHSACTMFDYSCTLF
jgi:hypothetical protein